MHYDGHGHGCPTDPRPRPAALATPHISRRARRLIRALALGRPAPAYHSRALPSGAGRVAHGDRPLAARCRSGSGGAAELAAQVRFLTGSAYVALAETTTSPTEAAEWWQSARQNLEAADIKSLPGVDLLKYQFRLARTWANSPGTDPNRTIEAMAASLSAGDDPAEGYRLLADLYAKLSPPDEVKARDSLRNFLKHASARADSRTLNLARLRLAELHLALHEPDEARKVLERVGPEAPPEVAGLCGAECG